MNETILWEKQIKTMNLKFLGKMNETILWEKQIKTMNLKFLGKMNETILWEKQVKTMCSLLISFDFNLSFF